MYALCADETLMNTQQGKYYTCRDVRAATNETVTVVNFHNERT